MKSLHLIWPSFLLSIAVQAGPVPTLAAPLQKYDSDHDGKLNPTELKTARQAHRRGGRDAEPKPERWKQFMNGLRDDLLAKHITTFDADKDGKVQGPEHETFLHVWTEIEKEYLVLRYELVAKYDHNDDGELNDKERFEGRPETIRRRKQIVEATIAKWKANPRTFQPQPPAKP